MSKKDSPSASQALQDLPSLQNTALPSGPFDGVWRLWTSPLCVVVVSLATLGVFFAKTLAEMKIVGLPWPEAWLWSEGASSLLWGIWGFLGLALAMEKAAAFQKGFFLLSKEGPGIEKVVLPLSSAPISLDKKALEHNLLRHFSAIALLDQAYLVAERGRGSAMGSFWLAACLPLALFVAWLASWFGHTAPLHLGLLFALPWAILGLFLQFDHPHEILVVWRQGSDLHLLGIAPSSPASLHQTLLSLQTELSCPKG